MPKGLAAKPATFELRQPLMRRLGRRGSFSIAQSASDSLACVDTPELTALLPAQMAQYPHCSWTIVTAGAPGQSLVFELHANAWPERVARIEVTPGGEVYFLSFAGQQVGPDFGYDDDEKVEALEDVVRDAVALTTGPSRITRTVVDGVVLTSSLELDPDGPNRRSLGVTMHHPLGYIKARLRGRRPSREAIDFPSAGDT